MVHLVCQDVLGECKNIKPVKHQNQIADDNLL